MAEPAAGADAGDHPDARPGAAAPRHMPAMRRRPPAAGEPTPAQARAIARAGLVLTLVLALVGVTGVVWGLLAVLGVVH